MISYVPNTAIVAAVQLSPAVLDVRANLKDAQAMAFEAAAKGASVVVLPELAISGFTLRNSREAAEVCQTKDGYQTQALAEVARKFGCHIVFGYVESSEGKLYNSAATIGPLGVLESNARKHNLYGNDYLWATPSDNIPETVITSAGRLGVLICRDVMNKYRDSYDFNAEQKFYRKGDADSIALLSNMQPDKAFPDSVWMEFVESNKNNLIISSRVGTERDLTFKGGSCIVDKTGNLWSNGSNFDSPAVVGGIVRI